MSIHGVLGESTSYPKTYDPQILYPISRQIGRDEIKHATGFVGVYQGVDVWQVFELSWLNKQGVSQVAMARLSIPADSASIIESKSLKLYFNSLNFSYFETPDVLKFTIQQDLSACVGTDVDVEIIFLTQDKLLIGEPMGECIDDVLADDVVIELTADIDSSPIYQCTNHTLATYQFYSNLLRSNCPVTNQPDWGTLQVTITTDKRVDYSAILTYILSFRQHNGFHEQCVERIFVDFMKVFEPSSLLVQANYTRRGGIDINPVRVFNHQMPKPCRLIRQ